MADINYKLTLTSKSANDSNYYVVTYLTASGGTYLPVTSGSPAYLPEVGSTASVSIPSASYSTLAFNLNNGIGGGCELCDNDVLLVVTGTFLPYCCPLTLTSVTTGSPFPYSNVISGTICTQEVIAVTASFTTGSGTLCLTGSYVQWQYNNSGSSTWTNYGTSSFTSPAFIGYFATSGSNDLRFRGYVVCSGGVTSSASNTSSFIDLAQRTCCPPYIERFVPSGSTTSSLFLNYVAYSSASNVPGCNNCSYVFAQSSSDGVTWAGWTTGACSPIINDPLRPYYTGSLIVNAPSTCGQTLYYRLGQVCGTYTSSFFNCTIPTYFSYTQTYGQGCCTPSIDSIAPANAETSSIYVYYSAGSGVCCTTCSYITLTTSSDGSSWGGAVTASCTGSYYTVTAPASGSTGYYRLQTTCSGSTTSSFSATASYYNSGSNPECTATSWKIDNSTNGYDVYWGGYNCAGAPIGGTVGAYSTLFGTGCVADGTLTYTGFPTVTVAGIC